MFQMIGHYEIARDGDVIRVWSSSEFNLEAAQLYARDMSKVVEQMPPRFATLVESDAPLIVAPEVEETMHNFAFQRAERGMVAVAFVPKNRAGMHIANAQWKRIYDRTGIAMQFFAELAAARAWLREQIDR